MNAAHARGKLTDEERQALINKILEVIRSSPTYRKPRKNKE